MLNTVGTQSYPVVFTPEDSNYNPYQTSVSVTVAKAPYPNQIHSVSVRYDDTSTQTVSLAGIIPADCGTVSLGNLRMDTLEGTAPVIVTTDFKIDGNNIVFTLQPGLTEVNLGTTITLTVTVTTTNYADFDVVLSINVVKEVTRTITFNANGGSGFMSPVTVADGASYTLPACGFTAPSGMRFKCWALDSASGAQYSAGSTMTIGADVTFYAVWETIPTTNPGGSTGGSSSGSTDSSDSSNSISVSTPSTSGNITTVIAEVKPTVTGTTATAVITSTSMDKAVDGALTAAVNNGTSPTVEISVDTPERADTLEVSLPANSLEKLGRHAGAALTITSGVADVTLDSDTISAVADQAGNRVTLSVEPVSRSELNSLQRAVVGDAFILDLRLISSNQVITDFRGGSATVAVPYELPSGVFAHEVTVWYLDDDGKMTACATDYDSRTGLVTFTTPHFSLYVISTETGTAVFGDVPASHWAYSEISWANASGYMTGKSAGTFDPNGSVSRQQVWIILAPMAGAAPADMTGAKTWAVENGISDGSNPEGAVTRQQLAALLYRYAAHSGHDVSVGESTNILSYTDIGQVSEYAIPAMQWACGAGIITGTGDGSTLSPQGTATRAQLVVMLYRWLV